ncbi:phage tail protein, partial [Yokenella regensburgei]
GEGSALPVGVPIPWPSATPPGGWLKCNGAAFTTSQYPKLALAYPTLRLPDLRGEFLRGWDDGRGVDSGRALLTSQGGSIESHAHNYSGTQSVTNSNVWSNTTGDGTRGFSGNTSSYGGSETRPRNIAFNYIVRAA